MSENSATIQGLPQKNEREKERQKKPAWPIPIFHTPNYRSIVRETLEQQEKEIEKREQNIVLFRVPESTKDSP